MLSAAKAQEIRSFTVTHGNPDRLQLSKAPPTHKVQLNWTVLAEKNIRRFEIERSQDNEHYRIVQSIPQHFSVGELQQFGSTDIIRNVGVDIFYYRLKIIGRSGVIRISPAQVVRLNQPSGQTPIKTDLAKTAIYPTK